ncbi:hypothetical protein KSC_002610 [Ktedonobacter sp. SOSP1-52]|uniref:hypothetical protein n=1 Tax=Ktedonobacter sp. SOSP1-52 TaxID=2778366 RepID=UPI001915D266|nr:hypothetical protein [Ktedonobacter sp. SOSP1-52]GHO61369.1 hypothetical protein KSC_002610 [Ktedonobacter sp. SOSP1-52]
MTKPKFISKYAENVLQSSSEPDLECLVRGIHRNEIIQLVKHDRYLQQRVFPGFRATHLPWERVPIKLARDAHDMERKIALLGCWLISNREVCEQVTQKIHQETLEDDVAKLLATTSINSDCLYWALRLDEREAIQQALKAKDLLLALLTPASDLMVRVERYRLAQELEVANAKITSQKEQLKDIEARHKSANHKIEELENQRVGLLQEKALLLAQNDELKQRGEKLNNQVVSLREAHTSLQAEVQHLHSLPQIYAQEAEEGISAKLLKLQNEVESAYAKRDEEREYSAGLEVKVAKLEYDKNALVHQKRLLHSQLEQTEKQLGELQQQSAQLWREGDTSNKSDISYDTRGRVEKQPRGAPLVNASAYDALWMQTVDALKFYFNLEEGVDPSLPPLSGEDRWSDWYNWQYIERLLIQPLLKSQHPLSEDKLPELDRAQKLLVLRWYILEWMKANVFE